ncbi:zinc knuckle CX2CX4HX4C containing protein [Tanacetum coccineum]
MEKRTKRNLKVPQNLEGFVHSINTNSTTRENNTIRNTKKGECSNEMKDQYEEQQENKGFDGDLLNANSDGTYVCLDTGDEDESVVKVAKSMEKKEGYSSNSSCGKENPWNLYNLGEGKKLVDIVKALKLDSKLLEILTAVNENGSKVAIFDDELIDLGSKRCSLTVCGQFIRCRGASLRQDEEGIKEVINNGPWMVNNKPMFVQKWCIDMCLDKAEAKKIPMWVKMLKIPMEAWSVKGISALASSLGKPIIMDEVTTRIRLTSVGRIGFARVLIEIDAEKEIKDKIKVIYKGRNVAEGTKKFVDVEYD